MVSVFVYADNDLNYQPCALKCSIVKLSISKNLYGAFILFYILLASNYENNFIIFCFGSPFLIRTTITKNYMNR